MSGTFVGNITEPQLTFTQSGTAKLEFRLPIDKRKKNRDTGEWETQFTSWWSVTLWGEQAQNAAPILAKGTRVIITGEPLARPYEDKDKHQRVSAEIDVQHIGVLIARKSAPQSFFTPAGGGFDDDQIPF